MNLGLFELVPVPVKKFADLAAFGLAGGKPELPAELAAALGDYRWESWITDGLSLILGGTGAALLLVGLGGTLSN